MISLHHLTYSFQFLKRRRNNSIRVECGLIDLQLLTLLPVYFVQVALRRMPSISEIAANSAEYWNVGLRRVDFSEKILYEIQSWCHPTFIANFEISLMRFAVLSEERDVRRFSYFRVYVNSDMSALSDIVVHIKHFVWEMFKLDRLKWRLWYIGYKFYERAIQWRWLIFGKSDPSKIVNHRVWSQRNSVYCYYHASNGFRRMSNCVHWTSFAIELIHWVHENSFELHFFTISFVNLIFFCGFIFAEHIQRH